MKVNSAILEGLNPKQREAVSFKGAPLLVLAGAGSGKTRVLTSKIAWLVRECAVAPWRILAVTFTNKAAREMKERVETMLGERAKDAQVSGYRCYFETGMLWSPEGTGETSWFSIDPSASP